VTIPSFAEANHQLVRSIQHYSDRELVRSYRQEPQQARFFVALFCRYSSITYSIIQHMAGDRIQIDYLFALAWQRVFDRLEQLEDSEVNRIQWQNWIVSTAGELINEEHLIVPMNQIDYRLEEVSPPLRCYVEHSLNLMQPLLRLVFMMSERWHWSTTKIASQLQAEGEDISEMDVPLYISESQKAFTKTLPTDLLDIYRPPGSILDEESLDIDTLGNIIVSQSSISARN
jgi:hypothetical protein